MTPSPKKNEAILFSTTVSINNEGKLIDNNGFINITPRKYKNMNIDGFFAARLTRND